MILSRLYEDGIILDTITTFAMTDESITAKCTTGERIEVTFDKYIEIKVFDGGETLIEFINSGEQK